MNFLERANEWHKLVFFCERGRQCVRHGVHCLHDDAMHESFDGLARQARRRRIDGNDLAEVCALPFAFIMRKGTVRKTGLDERPAPTPTPGRGDDLREGGALPTRAAALERFLAEVPPSAAVIATTGKCGRELFTLSDRPQHFYQIGSMGCASGMGLGVALNVDRPVVILDGDGAALMKMGTMATIGAYRPPNLIHVLLDNGVHDSTGGQATVSPLIDFPAIALACGYARALACDSLPGFARALGAAFGSAGPSFISLRILPGSMANLGRPTVAPDAAARRFHAFLTTA